MIEKIVESITGMSAEEIRKKSEEAMKQNAEFQNRVIKELSEINATLKKILKILGGGE